MFHMNHVERLVAAKHGLYKKKLTSSVTLCRAEGIRNTVTNYFYDEFAALGEIVYSRYLLRR